MRSNSTRTETLLELTAKKMKLSNLMRAVSVLWRGLKCYTGKKVNISVYFFLNHFATEGQILNGPVVL